MTATVWIIDHWRSCPNWGWPRNAWNIKMWARRELREAPRCDQRCVVVKLERRKP